MTIPLIQTKEIIGYSKALFISTWDYEKDTCFFKYWGSGIADYYGLDATGKYFSESSLGENTQLFIDFHKEIIDEKKIGYLSGTLDWREKEYRKWDQITMPLMRGGEVNETLTFLMFHRD